MNKNISICMIVKNEESILDKCLGSIAELGDEIIITDTGSTDNTIEIAKKFTDKIYHFDWIDDFSAARNYCSQFAKFKYILRWDADFFLNPEYLSLLKNLKEQDFDNKDKIFFNWNLGFGDDGEPIKTVKHFFLHKKDLFHWESPIHNKLIQNDPNQEISKFYSPKVFVDHLKDKDIKSHRYIQTEKILRTTIEKKPDDIYLSIKYLEALVFNNKIEEAIKLSKSLLSKTALNDNYSDKLTIVISLSQSYMRNKDFDKALELVEKYKLEFINNKLFMLTYADVFAVTDLGKAQKYYIQYMVNEIEIGDIHLYDFERYHIHPLLMLGQIFAVQKNNLEAKKYLNIVINESHLKKNIESATLIYATL